MANTDPQAQRERNERAKVLGQSVFKAEVSPAFILLPDCYGGEVAVAVHRIAKIKVHRDDNNRCLIFFSGTDTKPETISLSVRDVVAKIDAYLDEVFS